MEIAECHFLILRQTGSPTLKENSNEIIASSHPPIYQFLTETQVLLPQQLELPPHTTILQIDIGLVVPKFRSNAIKPLYLKID